jgi:hypothetical protein
MEIMLQTDHLKPDIVTNVEDAVRNVNEMVLSKNIADAICKRYPIEKGHHWGVHVDGHGGVVHIYHLNLSAQWGFTLKLTQVIYDPNYRMAVNAAGEILERYDVRRSKSGDIIGDIRGLKKDFTGEKCFDGHCALKYGRRVKSRVASRKPTIARNNVQPLVFN